MLSRRVAHTTDNDMSNEQQLAEVAADLVHRTRAKVGQEVRNRIFEIQGRTFDGLNESFRGAFTAQDLDGVAAALTAFGDKVAAHMVKVRLSSICDRLASGKPVPEIGDQQA